jgi:dipeptidyl aminopeptidase/acylaminoacyl peptidase
MNFTTLLVFLILISSCKAQETSIILSKNLITDFSKTPIFAKLTEDKNGIQSWKEEYKYIDSIDIYSIKYLSDGLEIGGLLVEPKKQGKYPCIIFNKGGGNSPESALKIGHGLLTLGQIAKEGYVVIASQYRGGYGSEGKDEFGGKDINDVIQLINVLEEVDNANTDKVGMYGWSRGTIMTFKSLLMTDKIDAVAVGGVVSDCGDLIIDRPEMEKVFQDMVPDYQLNKVQDLDSRSVIKWVDKLPYDVPILMLHGNADWRTKPEQALKLGLAFEKYRIPYRLIMYEGGDHGLSEHKKEVHDQVINWFDRFLKMNEPIPNMEYHGN